LVKEVILFPINTRSARVLFFGGYSGRMTENLRTRTELGKIDISRGDLIKGATLVVI